MIIQEGNNGNQQVIPRWMTYAATMRANELGPAAPPGALVSPQLLSRLDQEIDAFLVHRHHRLGGDLFERLIISGDGERAKRLAPYIAGDQRHAKPLRELAERTTRGTEEHFAEPTCDELIRLTRKRLRDEPRNGIRWVELARLYAISRQAEKADAALRIAKGLNPRDRFTLRAQIRFFLHMHDAKSAASVLGHKLDAVTDPWLKGVGLSALMLANRNPSGGLIRDPAAVTKEHLFDCSEWLAACGMLNLSDGRSRRAKDLFVTAWEAPSGNVTTHAEWVTRSLLPDLRPKAVSLRGMTPEAKAGRYFSLGLWREMHTAVEEWMLEEPYSRKPFRFLAHSFNVRGEFSDAVKWAERAVEGDTPDFGVRISLIYALLNLHRVEEAEALLHKFDVDSLRPADAVVVLANLGLLLVQKGKVDEGLTIYRRAEKDALKISGDLSARVFINSRIAAKSAGRNLDEEDTRRLMEMARGYQNDIAACLLINRVIKGAAVFKPPTQNRAGSG